MSSFVYLQRGVRRPRIPAAPLIAGSAWLLFVLAGIFLARKYNTPIELCLFKRLTGIPCPTCGSTTGSFLILQGRVIEGWLKNPFVFTLLPLLFCSTALQVTTGYRIRLNYSGKRRTYITIILITAIAANWGYIIFREAVR